MFDADVALCGYWSPPRHARGQEAAWQQEFLLKLSLKFLTGIKLPDLLLGGLNAYRKQADPTVRSIPLLRRTRAEFFEDLKDLRFADRYSFDFRGERRRSVGGNAGTLSNSNQRGGKGFITTHEVERTIAFMGKFKLDWIFVKPPMRSEPDAKKQPHRFAPHFGRTLKSLNDSVADSISDHDPIMVDFTSQRAVYP